MIIWSEFRIGQIRDDNYRKDAPHFTKIKERELTDFLDASLAINHIFFVVFKSAIFCFFDTTTVWNGISCCCIFFLKWAIIMSHSYESWIWVNVEGRDTYLCIFDEFLWILPIFVIFDSAAFEFSLNYIPRWGDWSFWSFPFLIGWLLGQVLGWSTDNFVGSGMVGSGLGSVGSSLG